MCIHLADAEGECEEHDESCFFSLCAFSFWRWWYNSIRRDRFCFQYFIHRLVSSNQWGNHLIKKSWWKFLPYSALSAFFASFAFLSFWAKIFDQAISLLFRMDFEKFSLLNVIQNFKIQKPLNFQKLLYLIFFSKFFKFSTLVKLSNF